jgi:hypothetical protein
MNNRIRDLAHEAGLLTYNPEGIPTKLEKFAELIVRECIDIASQEDFDVMMKEGYPCSQTAKKIQEHFGVEE